MNEQRIETTAAAMARKLNVSTERATPLLKRMIADLVRAELDDARRRRDPSGDAERRAWRDRHSGYVTIPFMPKSEQGRPLGRAIKFAAEGAAIDPHGVAMLTSYFLEGVVREVCEGELVRIPGFGVFGPNLWNSRDTGEHAVYPRFVASRGFRQQVRDTCRPDQARNRELRTYQRSHHPSSRPDLASSSTSSTMIAMRDIWAAESPIRGVLLTL